MPLNTPQTGKRIRTKALAAKVLLEAGETIRSTADALGIDKGTVLALSKEKILSDEDINLIERSSREKAAKVKAIGLDLLLEKNAAKLRKLAGNQIATVCKDMDKLLEGEKPDTKLLCNTLMFNKYVLKDTPPVDIDPQVTT
jgi:hypothetical protein